MYQYHDSRFAVCRRCGCDEDLRFGLCWDCAGMAGLWKKLVKPVAQLTKRALDGLRASPKSDSESMPTATRK